MTVDEWWVIYTPAPPTPHNTLFSFVCVTFSSISTVACFLLQQVAKEGIPLPSDKTLCPLCSQKRANPSVMAVSGFVFCYTCIFKYVNQVSVPISSPAVSKSHFNPMVFCPSQTYKKLSFMATVQALSSYIDACNC